MAYMIPILPGTKSSTCRFCPERIYWAPHPSTGRDHPVSVKAPDAYAPSPTAEGLGVSHFSNCPGADRARRSS